MEQSHRLFIAFVITHKIKVLFFFIFLFFFFIYFYFFHNRCKKKTFTYKKLNAYLSLLGKEKKYTKQMKHKELSLIGIKSNFSHTTICYTN